MHHKHLATNIRKWFEYYHQMKTMPEAKEAELAGLTYVQISTAGKDVNWMTMWQWLEENGTPDTDFFLYWHSNVAHAYFRDDQVAMMFKLRWI